MKDLVRLLGPPRIHMGDEIHMPSSTMTAAVAYYLAATHGWVSRDEICGVFWGDSAQERARSSLRQVLHRLRKAPYAQGIEADSSRVAWNVATDLDSGPEQAGLGDHGRTPRATSTATAPVTLLEGFQCPIAPGFEEWLERGRATILQDRRARAHEQARLHAESGRSRDAIDVLEPWLAFDELDERTLQLYLEAAPDAGVATEGVRRYERFRKTLETELGMVPAERTVDLSRGLAADRSGDSSELDPRASHVGNTYASKARAGKLSEAVRWSTELIGRTAEQERLERWLANPGAAGIYGAGGIGKTRLASECFQRMQDRYPDSAWLVHLGSVSKGEEALAVIAQAMDLGSTAAISPIDLLTVHLSDRDALLVLDNLEQIDDASGMTRSLLGRCTQLRILVTSRIRLDLPQGRAVELRGLPINDGNVSVMRPSTAAQMFIAAVERHGRTVDLDVDLPQIEAFCASVHGMPLAVEHAAAWTRLMPVRPSLDRWIADPDALPPFSTDADPRHATIHRVFQASWDLLDSADRDALRRLQVFHGGCDIGAALDVAGVGIAGLSRLRDHAMIDIDDNGRVVQHPLLTEWLKRTAPPDADLAERHARHFMELLAQAEYDGQNVDPPAAVRRISRDLANCEGAWTAALRQGVWELFELPGPMFGITLMNHRRAMRWPDLLEEASRQIPADHPAWARMEAHAAGMSWHDGNVRGWFERGRRARDAARRHGDPVIRGWSSHIFGNAAAAMDRRTDALEAKRETLQQFRRTGQGGLIAIALMSLYRIEPDRAAREGWYRELETLCANLEMPTLTAEVAVPRAYGLAHDWGRHADALAMARSAVAVQQEAASHLSDLAASLVAQAHVLNYLGNPVAAERCALEALERTADLSGPHGFDPRSASVEIALARRLRGDASGAHEALASASSEIFRGREGPTADIHKELAELALAQDDLASARAHANAASAVLPKRPWRRQGIESLLGVQLLYASIAAREGAHGADRLLRDVLARAWEMRFIPLTLHTLAHLLPWLEEREQPRVSSLLDGSPATPFEARVLLARHGVSPASRAPHAADEPGEAYASALETELAEIVARSVRA